MTQPVPVLPGASILNARRIIEGRFHLSPDPVVNQINLFALAYNANKYGIRLYAHSSLPNHHHNVFHDTAGKHVEFRRDLHSQITRSINAHRGMSEAKWSPDHKSPVILFGAESVLDRIAYTMAQPARHHLVERPSEWLGVVTKVDELAGPPRLIHKPACFYDPHGDVPDSVALRFHKPPELEHLTDEEYRAEVSRRIEQLCQKAKAERRRLGISVVGRRGVRAQSPTDAPRSSQPIRTRNPRIACSVRSWRIALLLWLNQFRFEHRQARLEFEAGSRTVVFPLGTFLHARRYGVDCSSVGPPGWVATSP